jgi:exonuclease III
MSRAVREIKIVSWNVQGVGCVEKCPIVRNVISRSSPSIVCLQETKLRSVDRFIAASLLPPNLSAFATLDSVGSSGGILTARDPRDFALVSTRRDRFSLSVGLVSTSSSLSFVVSNVYAPANHSLTPVFLAEFEDLGPLFAGPWIIAGDFNLVRDPEDKNNGVIDLNLSSAFNDSIRSLAIFELPLLDRLFTWSNKRASPILAQIDHVFFNQGWNLILPNSSLSSLPCPTSDHVPLLVTASTTIPRPTTFRFENSWLLDPLFLPTTLPSWTSPCVHSDAAADLAARLKSFRSAAKVWKHKHRFNPLLENNCRFIIDLFDFLEESRVLSVEESLIRASCRSKLADLVLECAARWK